MGHSSEWRVLLPAQTHTSSEVWVEGEACSTTCSRGSRRSGAGYILCLWTSACLPPQIRHTGVCSAGDAGTHSDAAHGRPLSKDPAVLARSPAARVMDGQKARQGGSRALPSTKWPLQGQVLATSSTRHPPPASWGARNWPLEGQCTPTPNLLLKCVSMWCHL